VKIDFAKMKLIVFCLAAGLVATGSASGICKDYSITNNAEDVSCPNNFKDYLECTIPSVETAVENIVESSIGQSNYDLVNKCFTDNGCSSVNFTSDNALDLILPCKNCDSDEDRKKNCVFRYAADKVVGLLKSIPKEVGSCMVEYFKEIGQKMVQDCARDERHNPVSPEYTQSAIPGLQDFDIDELGDVIVFQVLMRYNLLKCKTCGGSSGNEDQITNCLSGTVIQNENVCEDKSACEQKAFGQSGSCKNRFDQVTGSVCSCAASAIDKVANLGSLDLNDPETKKQLGELKKIFGSDMKRRLKTCYKSTYKGKCYSDQWDGANGMRKQYNSMMGAVLKAVLKFARGEVNDQMTDMLFIAKAMFTDLQSKWSDVLCGSDGCTTKDDKALTAAALRAMLTYKTAKYCTATEIANAGGSCVDDTFDVSTSRSSAFGSFFNSG
jgi:hypothetical protein